MKPAPDREVDDLDYLIRDALWSSYNIAPPPERALVALRARIENERQPARKSCVTPAGVSTATSASYWYLMPLLRVLR